MSQPVYLLYTNIISHLWRIENASAINISLVNRMASVSPEQIVISMITMTEQMQGMINLVRSFEKINREDEAYAVYFALHHFLQRFTLIAYDADAHRRFLTFPANVRRQGRADCQIAALAIERGYTVVTENVKHFAQIPGVTFEDWTRPGTNGNAP